MPSAGTGPRRRPAVLLCAVILPVALAPACGKKGLPLPPLKIRPERVEELRIRQVGEKLILSMSPPDSRDDGTALGVGARLEIMMTAREPIPKSGKEVELDHSLRWSIAAGEWHAYEQGQRLDVTLSLGRIAEGLGLSSEPGVLRGRELSFIAEVVESRKERSLPSNLWRLRVCEPPRAPIDVAGRLLEEGLLITWAADGSRAGEDAPAFNVFRREPESPHPESPLNPSPSRETSFLDSSAVYDGVYIYSVRTASKEAGCESAEGTPILAIRKDIFPPAAPEGLAAVAERGAIRLFWRPNRETDLRGYRVYRAEGAYGAMELQTPEILTSTTYTDESAAEGVVYSYAVTALDGASPRNESAFSIPAVETLESR